MEIQLVIFGLFLFLSVFNAGNMISLQMQKEKEIIQK